MQYVKSMKLGNPRNKRDDQAEETYVRIVQAGVRLFARQGYHKTTIADLTQAIGLTSGAIFHHFPTKEAILEAVIDSVKRGILEYAHIADREQNGSLAVVEATVRAMCAHFQRRPEATICLAVLATEFAGSNHPVEAKLKGVYDIFVTSFARVLENNESVSDAGAAAIAFFAAAQGIAVQGLLRKGELSIDELADGFMSLLKRW